MKRWMLMVGMLAVVGQTHAVEWVKRELIPGGYVVGKVAPGSTVTLRGAGRANVAPDGTFGVGFERLASATQVLEVCGRDGCETVELPLAARTYAVQAVVGVPGKTVNPNPAEEKVIAADNKAIHAARDKVVALEAFAGDFGVPVSGTASGFFGSRRVYNGEERSWHKGYDLAAPRGTPVYAPAEGVVTLARPTFMTGNLIVLDHGYGFNTLYAHLTRMDVGVGDHVKAGQRLGTVGTTGRSTGPHLHWGFYWHNVALDPQLLIQHNEPTKGE